MKRTYILAIFLIILSAGCVTIGTINDRIMKCMEKITDLGATTTEAYEICRSMQTRKPMDHTRDGK